MGCLCDARQEQEGWQATGISEDTADASSSRQELGLSAPDVRKREQQNGQEGKKLQMLNFHHYLFTGTFTVDLLDWFWVLFVFP